MEAKELIALFMIGGCVFLGAFVPLYKYIRHVGFYGACLAFVIAYTFLASKSFSIPSDLSDVYVILYKNANLQNYFIAAFTSIFYLVLAVVCSFVYDKIYIVKNRKDLRWIVVLVLGTFAALFYDRLSFFDKGYFYFNIVTSMLLPVAYVLFLFIVPVFMMFIPRKKD